MATKKQTKSTTKKTTKKSSGSNKKIQLTFKPVVSAARELNIRLKKREYQQKDGREVQVYVPKIEGLPMNLVVKKDEIIEVTKQQLEQLEELGLVETEEEYKQRQKFVDNLDPQHPDSLSYSQLSNNNAFLTVRDSNYIYTDKLIRV